MQVQVYLEVEVHLRRSEVVAGAAARLPDVLVRPRWAAKVMRNWGGWCGGGAGAGAGAVGGAP